MKFLHFCAIGLLSLSSLTFAKDNFIDVKTKLKQQIEQTIEQHYQSKALSVKPSVHISLVPSLETLSQNAQLKNTSVEKIMLEMKNQPESFSTTTGTQCDISLVFDDQENIPFVDSVSKKIPSISFTNPQQKKMSQEFLALHESFHCQFKTIAYPILTPGKSEKFQQHINFLLKDDLSSNSFHKLSYIDLLGENFADVGASFALINQYGASNKDLQHVLNVIMQLRHYSYFEDLADTHFSHFSLEEVLDDKTITLLKDLPIIEQKKLALEVANRGVNKTLQYNTILTNFIFTQNGLIDGIYINALNIAIHQSLPAHLKPHVPLNTWSDNIERGYSFNVAYELFKDEKSDLKFHKDNGEFINTQSELELNNYVLSLLKKKQPNLSTSITYSDNMKKLNEFKNYVMSVKADTEHIDYISKTLTDEQMLTKVNYLKTKIK